MSQFVKIGNYIGGLTGTWYGPVVASAAAVYLVKARSGNAKGGIGVGMAMGGGLLGAGIEAAVRAAAPARDPAATVAASACKLSDLADKPGWPVPLPAGQSSRYSVPADPNPDVMIVPKDEVSIRKVAVINRAMVTVAGRGYKVDHPPFSWRQIRRELEALGWALG